LIKKGVPVEKDQHETASEARRNALAFSMGFGELRSSDTLVEMVDELLEGFSLVNISAVNIPDSVKFGKTKDPSKNALADYSLYRKTHFSSRKCSPECPYCCRARQKRVVKEAKEDYPILTQRDAKLGVRMGYWQIVKASAKVVTISMVGGSSSPRFRGKKYQFRWDGTGYKRQGEYLYLEPPE
jgi:hypothetical protein